MIEVKNLKKSFNGNVILENVDFTVEQGDSIVIIGGSGCGKSTLLRCINKLIVPDEGEIIYKDQNILEDNVNIDEYRRHVGMVYQQFNLFDHLNVMENMILAPMKVLKMSQEDAIAKAEKLLDKVGMLNRKYQMPSALSGGQKQRVAIARTLMMDPDVILFDEPTSALDPTMVDEVESVIADLVKDGITSIIVTHEMRFAKNIASRVFFLAEKGIYEQGTPEEIFEHPQKELTRKFIYRARLFEKEVRKEDTDYYELASEMRAFALPYGCTRHQADSLAHLLEELVMPTLDLPEVTYGEVALICSESGTGHKLLMRYPELDKNPMEIPAIDELVSKFLTIYSSDIHAEKNAEGIWEVSALF